MGLKVIQAYAVIQDAIEDLCDVLTHRIRSIRAASARRFIALLRGTRCVVGWLALGISLSYYMVQAISKLGE